MKKDNICPNCGASTVQGHPEDGCVLASLIQIVRERENLDEDSILKLHTTCDTDALWEQLGPILDKLERGDFSASQPKECAEHVAESQKGPEKSPVPIYVVFEWVYPDENGDSVKAIVNTKTGAITLLDSVPEDIVDPRVRHRIWFDIDNFLSESDLVNTAGDGTDYEVVRANGSWFMSQNERELLLTALWTDETTDTQVISERQPG